MRNYRNELENTINFIGENLYIDPEEKTIKGKKIPHWNTTLLATSYVLEKNTLIMGEPGFAKTTAMKVISSLMSGYPFDLYEAAQIQGHPDQTYETMIGRVDLSKLTEKEEVIWLLSAYLPVRNIDEINRLPAGNQVELLNSLETGRFSHLNSTFFTGRSPFFATANHPDDGNHILVNPLRDRFSVHVELGYIGATYDIDIETAVENIEELCRHEITDKIISVINDNSKSIKERLELIDKERNPFLNYLKTEGIITFNSEDRKNIQKEIKSIPFTNEAKIFYQMINAEMNYTSTFGRKRSCDKVDSSNHANKLASTKVMNACSSRSISALKLYSQTLCYLTKEKEVSKEQISALAPYLLGHKFDFNEDFVAGHADEKRKETQEMYLVKKLIEGIEINYTGDGKGFGVKQEIDLLFTALKYPQELSSNQKKKVKEILADKELLDHPLAREYVDRLKGRF